MAKSRNRKLADLIVTAGVDIAGNVTFDGGSTSADLTFADGDKANFGAASDLQIYHDGSDSFIDEAGTGALAIRSNSINLQKYTGETTAVFTADGASELYYDNAKKLETTSTGINVTGITTSDTLVLEGTGVNTTYFTGGDASVSGRQLTLSSEAAGGQNNATHRLTVPSGYGSFNVTVNGKERVKINNNGDVSFYNDASSNAVKMFWDTSAESLGIGTASPEKTLHVKAASNQIRIQDSTNDKKYDLNVDGDKFMIDDMTAGANRLTVSGVNVGIGTTSPALNLHVVGAVRVDNNEGVATRKIRSNYFSNGQNLTLASGTSANIIMETTNVGIGTASPDAKLHVQSTGSDGVIVRTTTNVEPFIALQRNSGSNGVAVLRSIDGGDLRIDTGATGAAQVTKMTIEAGGNVGIGTTSPQVKLQVNDSGTTVPTSGYGTGFNVSRADGLIGMTMGYLSTNNTMYIQGRNFTNTDSQTILLNPNGGIIGIGTTAPYSGSKLTVQTAQSDAYSATSFNSDSLLRLVSVNADTNYSGIGFSNVGGNYEHFLGSVQTSANTADMVFQGYDRAASAYKEYLRITDGGNVGIGTTSPTNAKLEVVATSGEVFRADSASGAYRIVANQTGVSMQGTISVAGTVTSTGKVTAQATDSEFYNRLFIKNGTHGLYMGQWDGSNHRIEADANRPLTIQAYNSGGITLGISGSSKLVVTNAGVSTPTKLAVMSSSPHGSYDFYNNGTSYFNGSVIIDDHLSITGTSAQLTLSRTSTDQTAGFNITNNQNGGYGSGIVWNSKRTDAGVLTAAEITVSGENAWNSDATSSSMMQFATRKDNTLTTHMTIRKSGNVGIGVTSPHSTLQVDGPDSAVTAHFGQGQSNSSGVFGGISLGYAENANSNYRKVAIVAKALSDGAARQDLHFLVDTVNDQNSAGLADSKMMIKGLNGNVGIRTDVPQQAFQVDGNVRINHPDSGGSPAMTATLEMYGYEGRGVGIKMRDSVNSASSASNREWFVGTGYNTSSFGIGYASDGSQSSYNAQNKLTVAANGNVGIGTTGPVNTLDLGAATLGRALTFAKYSNVFSEYSNASLWLASNFYGTAGASGYKTGTTGNFGAAGIRVHGTGGGNNSGIIQFYTDVNSSKTADAAFTPTETMRIDENGNLLVGKTVLDNSTVGIRMNATGDASFVADGARPLVLNRKTSDGDIALFMKDNTTIGSIGAFNTVMYFAGPNASTGGFRIDSTGTNGVIIPTTNTGANRDAATDLGYSSGGTNVRFRDLYLSNSTIVALRTTFGSGGFWDNASNGNNVGVKTGGNHIFLTDGNGGVADGTKDIGIASRRVRNLYLSGISYTNKVVAQTIFREGSDGSGLHFTTNAIYPTNETSAISDGTETLGAPAYRFKDLYLSGGAYLGGTGSLNKLDDYEEGTWTPSFSNAGSPSYSTQYGRYTKVGRIVYCTIAIRATSVSGSSHIGIAGLPFTPADTGDTQQRSTYSPSLGGHCSGLSEATGRFRTKTNTTMAGVKGSTTTTYMTATEFSSGGSPQITGDFWYYTS